MIIICAEIHEKNICKIFMAIVTALCVDFYGVLSRVCLLQIHALLWCLYDSM